MGKTKAQEKIITALVDSYRKDTGSSAINWDTPALDGSDNVCLVMILKWTKQANSNRATPTPGWTLHAVISPEGRVVQAAFK
jgi:hypothetical protein